MLSNLTRAAPPADCPLAGRVVPEPDIRAIDLTDLVIDHQKRDVVLLALLGGLAILAGVLGYFLAGQSPVAALFASWLVLAALAVGLVPLIALAFRRFDVARDTPP